jgi:hypothetical protein
VFFLHVSPVLYLGLRSLVKLWELLFGSSHASGANGACWGMLFYTIPRATHVPLTSERNRGAWMANSETIISTLPSIHRVIGK